MIETMETGVSGSTTGLAALIKCAHPACTCTVASGERFCSDTCAERFAGEASARVNTCDCGHLECAHAAIGRSPPVGGAIPI